MKSTRFWLVLFLIILLVSFSYIYFLYSKPPERLIANVYLKGECVYSIDLAQVDEMFSLEIEGKLHNTIVVDKGRIRVSEATCPDQICVHQSWISDGVLPIVCLPNELVIQIEDSPGVLVDAVSR